MSTERAHERGSQHRVSLFFLDVLVGSAVLLFNFSGFLRYAVRHWLRHTALSQPLSQPLLAIAHLPHDLLVALQTTNGDIFSHVLPLCMFGVWGWFGMVVLLAIVRWNPLIAVTGVGGFALGIAFLAALAWLVGPITGTAAFAIAAVASACTFLLDLAHAIAPFVGVAALVIAISLVVIFAMSAVPSVLRDIANLKLNGHRQHVLHAGVLLAVGVVIFLLRDVMAPVWNGVSRVGQAIYAALSWLIYWLHVVEVGALVLGVVVLILGGIGALVTDQFRSGWEAGGGHRRVLMASFGIAVAFALVVIQCSGSHKLSRTLERDWKQAAVVAKGSSPNSLVNQITPASVRTDLKKSIRTTSAPAFDASLLLLILVVSYLGIVRGFLTSEEDRFGSPFVHRDVVLVATGLSLALLGVGLWLLADVLPREGSGEG